MTVESGSDLVENDSTFHTDVDKAIVDRLPLESQSSSLSSVVTLVTPGIAADSNGSFHGLGDHAENSFSVDGQPITDQQSKTFSNQVPLDSVQSMEVISGAPPAEYGEKTSIVINLTTRSGQGVKKPTGSLTTSYGSFGTANVGMNFAYGGDKLGNFVSANALNSGRFLDPPEFAVMHAKGNEENIFDRVDFQLSTSGFRSRESGIHALLVPEPRILSMAQNATAWKGLVVNNNGLDPNGNVVGPADQRSQIKTFNIAPSWIRLVNSTTVFTLGAFVRRDQYNYYPSGNPFADLAPDLQSQTVGQDRSLTNAGTRSNISYVKGVHNVKAGLTYQQTFLNENDTIGVVDPTFLASLSDANGNSCVACERQPHCGSLHNPSSLRPHARWYCLPVSWAYRCEAARPLPAGYDQQRKLVAQPWLARRFL